ncbi:MAG: autotransporter-associated beta strand repeat-containing protein [Puniceicoccales bacterium]
MKNKTPSYAASLCLMLGALSSSVYAADSSWTGGGSDDLWSTAGNWSGTPDGTFGSSDVLTLGLSSDTTPVVDDNSPWYLERLVFAGSGATSLSGNTLSMTVPSVGYMISVTGTGSYTVDNDIDVAVGGGGSFLQMSSGNASQLRLNGDITLGSGDKLLLRGSASNATLYGKISGLGNTEVELGKTETGSWRFYNGNNQISKITHERGNIRLGVDQGFGDGVELDFRPASGHSASVSLQGFTQRFGGITTANASETAGDIEFFSYNPGGEVIYDRDSGSGDQTFSGRFGTSSSAGQFSITKEGTNTFTLTGDSEYTGSTSIHEGTLALSGDASISESSNIAVASGAFFDVSGLTSGFTLEADQALSGSGTIINTGKTLQVQGTLSPESGTLIVDGGILALGGDASMAFELGTVSDEISLINSSELNLGSESFGFSDLAITMGSGFGAGTYTLISSGVSISGELDSSDLSGSIGAYTGTLEVNGTSLELTVIPESSSYSAIMGFVVFSSFVLFRRRR